jgi:hypothetical protein
MVKKNSAMCAEAMSPQRTTTFGKRHIVQVLDGYTDGKPSWRRVFVGGHSLITKETAQEAANKLAAENPKRKYRVRTINKRGRR